MDTSNSDGLTSEESLIDHRRSQRRRALKKALIVYRGGHCTIGCRIVDTSDAGALLKPADVTMCPKEFVLKPDAGPSRSCEVVWRHGELVGIRFLDAPGTEKTNDKSVELDDFLALRRDHEALVADFQRLRHTVKQLLAQAGR